MKKIKDERLILITLKNVRIAFIFQTLSILAILIYTAIVSGPNVAFDSPLFFVMTVTTVIFFYLQMGVSVDIEATEKKQKKRMPYYGLVLIASAIGLIVGLLLLTTDSNHPIDALISGFVFFGCFLAAFSFSYYLRKKREKEDD
ncbi:branched-chain amino acid ABC transporter substrate-binding protein [Sporolactobacillus pectinivorans]|uniref:branched-chain amino acid ABC transporter substrate-binding protein n=1 Tax=Sporolactobacillus pectinivorans TaxID=1591408 RepID=UPI000C25DCAC|nr:branched-chain amino acid ABC transporter substrate-binding protein [Sporolactobacillus pectinivorans]